MFRLHQSRLTADDAKKEIHALILRMADIFAGRNGDYAPIKGYNGYSLDGKIMARLGPHWSRTRANYNDDATSVFFDWLAALVMEKAKTADGDDELLGVMLKPTLQSANKILLGIDEV